MIILDILLNWQLINVFYFLRNSCLKNWLLNWDCLDWHYIVLIIFYFFIFDLFVLNLSSLGSKVISSKELAIFLEGTSTTTKLMNDWHILSRPSIINLLLITNELNSSALLNIKRTLSHGSRFTNFVQSLSSELELAFLKCWMIGSTTSMVDVLDIADYLRFSDTYWRT